MKASTSKGKKVSVDSSNHLRSPLQWRAKLCSQAVGCTTAFSNGLRFVVEEYSGSFSRGAAQRLNGRLNLRLFALESLIRQAAWNQIRTHPLERIKVPEQLKRLLMYGPPLRTRREESPTLHVDAPSCTARQ